MFIFCQLPLAAGSTSLSPFPLRAFIPRPQRASKILPSENLERQARGKVQFHLLECRTYSRDELRIEDN